MKHLPLRSAIFMLSIAVMLATACRKSSADEQQPEPEYTSEQIAMLDNAVNKKLTLRDIRLPNDEIAADFLPDVDTAFFNLWLSGRSAQSSNTPGPLDAKNLLIKKMTAIALNLVDRNKHPYTGQNGIAYSYGAKNYKVKEKPAASNCATPVHGLDCSGLMYQIFQHAGVSSFPQGNAEMQRQPATIQGALETAFPNLKKIKVEDLGRLETAKMMTGDIIYWKNNKGSAFHIGIVLKNLSGELVVFQSNGSPGNDQADCEKNLGLSRGPRTVALDNAYWFGSKMSYGIVRFNFELQGKWNLHFRCAGAVADAFLLPLDFPAAGTGVFSLTKPFIDYDGSDNTAYMNFRYDNTTNELSCEMIIKDGGLPLFERKDRFTLKLKRDDSGYLPAELVYINNGVGCNAEVRLVNKE
jgi:hypothetical protein